MVEEKKEPWTWTPEGVRFGDQEFKFRQFTAEELDQFLTALDRANEVFGILHLARQRFETGAIDYRGACDRLNVLLGEHEKAQCILRRVARGVGLFFEPAGLGKLLDLDGEPLHGFVRDALGKLQERVPKESEPE